MIKPKRTILDMKYIQTKPANKRKFTYKFVPEDTMPPGAYELTLNYKILNKNKIKISSADDADKYLRKYCYKDNIEYRELSFLILLDRRNNIVASKLLSMGSKHGTVFDIPLILNAALIGQASGIIIAHNHPGGECSPSQVDILHTTNLIKATKVIEVPLLDHLIITSDKYLSMFSEGYFDGRMK